MRPISLVFCILCQQEALAQGDNPKRYLLYDTNPGEGFNLRRDVFIRIANLVKDLRKSGVYDWRLVLPPWGRIGYHWQERDMEQSRIPWKAFFEVDEINRYIPVMELEEYFEEIGEDKIDEVWYLQRYAEGWGSGFVERIHERDCIDAPAYNTDQERKYRGWFFGYPSTHATGFKCVSVQGFSSILVDPLNGGNTTSRSIMLDRAENVLHKNYGQFEYWNARRSLVFSKELRAVAANFRADFLDSTDEKDETDIWTRHWDNVVRDVRKPDALGGPYIAVHLRRKDFLYARKAELPSLKGAANEIKKRMKEFDVTKVFIATDGVQGERDEMRKLIGKDNVFFFDPSPEMEKKFKKGGIAIIDQIICANGRYFTGSKESTFTFRIQEEREIMGFHPDRTYNRLCPDDRQRACLVDRKNRIDEREDTKLNNCCDHHTHWKVAYEANRNY